MLHADKLFPQVRNTLTEILVELCSRSPARQRGDKEASSQSQVIGELVYVQQRSGCETLFGTLLSHIYTSISQLETTKGLGCGSSEV